MLGKLLKYDLKWVYKVIIVFYILAFAFSALGRGLSLIQDSVIFSIITQICFGIAIAMMVNCLMNSVIRLWVRFIRNSYKDESYLTHTLPVKKSTIYASKVLSALITVLITTIVIVLCLFICYYSEENMEIVKTALELAASTYNTTVINLLLLISIVIFLQIMFIVLVGYVGIILGHRTNKNKIVKTVIMGFGLYMITQIFSLCLIFISGAFSPKIKNLINTTGAISVDTIKYLMYAAIGLYLIYIAFYYVLGKRSFEKGVNVE